MQIHLPSKPTANDITPEFEKLLKVASGIYVPPSQLNEKSSYSHSGNMSNSTLNNNVSNNNNNNHVADLFKYSKHPLFSNLSNNRNPRQRSTSRYQDNLSPEDEYKKYLQAKKNMSKTLSSGLYMRGYGRREVRDRVKGLVIEGVVDRVVCGEDYGQGGGEEEDDDEEGRSEEEEGLSNDTRELLRSMGVDLEKMDLANAEKEKVNNEKKLESDGEDDYDNDDGDDDQLSPPPQKKTKPPPSSSKPHPPKISKPQKTLLLKTLKTIFLKPPPELNEVVYREENGLADKIESDGTYDKALRRAKLGL